MIHQQTQEDIEQAKEALQRFYDDLQTWVNNGCPPATDDQPFRGDLAMCACLDYWRMHHEYDVWIDKYIHDLLLQDFKKEDLDTTFPFNDDMAEFAIENTWTNPRRLLFLEVHSNVC